MKIFSEHVCSRCFLANLISDKSVINLIMLSKMTTWQNSAAISLMCPRLLLKVSWIFINSISSIISSCCSRAAVSTATNTFKLKAKLSKHICPASPLPLPPTLSFSRLWVVRLLWRTVRHLQHDDTNGDCSGPVRGDHPASGLPGGDVSQESRVHCGCYLGLLHGLEPAPLLWLEWVLLRPWHWVIVDQCDSSEGFGLLSSVIAVLFGSWKFRHMPK